MKTGFIGAGKLGFTLGKYFREHGACVTGYYSRSPKSAKEASEFTGSKYFELAEQVVAESDIVFLTVPDTAIETVWDSIKLMPLQGKLICHCSGALSSGIFGGIDQKDAYGYSLHPFLAIGSKLESYKELSKAFFTLEGHVEHLYDIKRFMEGMGNPVHIIEETQKVKYHAAAVFLSNHVTALAYTGCELLKTCGFEESTAQTALQTLFFCHSGAIAENGLVQTLTGPVERNDLLTVKKHLNCLEDNEKSLYGLLSLQLIKVSKEKHPDSDYTAMEMLIQEEMENRK